MQPAYVPEDLQRNSVMERVESLTKASARLLGFICGENIRFKAMMKFPQDDFLKYLRSITSPVKCINRIADTTCN